MSSPTGAGAIKVTVGDDYFRRAMMYQRLGDFENALINQRKLETAATQFHAALAIDPRNIESLVNLSTVEKESGRRDQARVWLTRALDADPRNAEGHYNFGLLEDEAGKRAQAVAHYRAFLQYGAANHASLVGEVRARLQKLEASFQILVPRF